LIKKSYKDIKLTVNWDIDNQNLKSIRNIRLPNLEISFKRDFSTPDIWIFESEDFNFEAIYAVKERPQYFPIYFARRFFYNIEDVSSIAMKLASQRILFFVTLMIFFYF